MIAHTASARQHFLDFVQAARYEEGIPPEDIQDADEPSLTFTLRIDGIWFELEHVSDPTSQVEQDLLVRALLFKLPDEPSASNELLLREALYASRRTMHSFTGAFCIDAEEGELQFLTTLPVGTQAKDALAVLRQVASALAAWRGQVGNVS